MSEPEEVEIELSKTIVFAFVGWSMLRGKRQGSTVRHSELSEFYRDIGFTNLPLKTIKDLEKLLKIKYPIHMDASIPMYLTALVVRIAHAYPDSINQDWQKRLIDWYQKNKRGLIRVDFIRKDVDVRVLVSDADWSQQ